MLSLFKWGIEFCNHLSQALDLRFQFDRTDSVVISGHRTIEVLFDGMVLSRVTCWTTHCHHEMAGLGVFILLWDWESFIMKEGTCLRRFLVLRINRVRGFAPSPIHSSSTRTRCQQVALFHFNNVLRSTWSNPFSKSHHLLNIKYIVMCLIGASITQQREYVMRNITRSIAQPYAVKEKPKRI